ncbi:DUF1365 domain-containing protein [Arcobacter sp. YIC-464]|uniref:DUF1365 domain-containing protein n=1 Tax=Arcobacter sp. YIC-464 TaxID=3376631 RepID=UPI003C29B8EE
MSAHQFYDGVIYHKRFLPKSHDFKYKFFMLDIDTNSLDELKTKLFSYNKLNLFSFKSKDHFGKQENFLSNIDELLKKFDIQKPTKTRFITLPRILNFVFNPISLLLLFNEKDELDYILAEVHNYNGGRVIYPVKLHHRGHNLYRGEIPKDMYVSPFFKRDGDYSFLFRYDKSNVALKIDLFEENKKMLTASFSGTPLEFSNKSIIKLFLKHTFLTFFVVTRTLWQSLKLYKKGLKFNSVEDIDTKRRY